MPSAGSPFHCLHATSHALQPMHRDASVKKPIASCLGGASISLMPSHIPGLTSLSLFIAATVPSVLLYLLLHVHFYELAALPILVEPQQPHVVIPPPHRRAVLAEVIRPARSHSLVAIN